MSGRKRNQSLQLCFLKQKKPKVVITKDFVRVVTLSQAPELGATMSIPRRDPSKSVRACQTRPGQHQWDVPPLSPVQGSIPRVVLLDMA